MLKMKKFIVAVGSLTLIVGILVASGPSPTGGSDYPYGEPGLTLLPGGGWAYTPPSDGPSSGSFQGPRPDYWTQMGGQLPYISGYATSGHVDTDGTNFWEIWSCSVSVKGHPNDVYVLEIFVCPDNSGTWTYLNSTSVYTDQFGNGNYTAAWSTTDGLLPPVNSKWYFRFELYNVGGSAAVDQRLGHTDITPW